MNERKQNKRKENKKICILYLQWDLESTDYPFMPPSSESFKNKKNEQNDKEEQR